MKKRCSPECKEDYLHIWEETIADNLEAFDDIRHSLPCGPSKHVKTSKTLRDRNQAKLNQTLIGTDFISSAGLVLYVKNTCRYFWYTLTHNYAFGEELDSPFIAEKISSNTCQLKEGEGVVKCGILSMEEMCDNAKNKNNSEGAKDNVLADEADPTPVPSLSDAITTFETIRIFIYA
ncbi:hypothetical protein NPIL_190531 [Nephila pilipes]|uniref:Uncharacterized protein n=1 Tax=Nephila pilipes TaxID=299642 RepID=A0A8X6PRZ7_NEPPI|nr:hypothetical protein NPIL_190531 [Nephila pilipes]